MSQNLLTKKISSELRLFKRSDPYSPSLNKRKRFFHETSSDEEAAKQVPIISSDESDPENTARGRLNTGRRTMHKDSSKVKFLKKESLKLQTKKLKKATSKMFIKGTDNSLRAEEELYPSENEVKSDSENESENGNLVNDAALGQSVIQSSVAYSKQQTLKTTTSKLGLVHSPTKGVDLSGFYAASKILIDNATKAAASKPLSQFGTTEPSTPMNANFTAISFSNSTFSGKFEKILSFVFRQSSNFIVVWNFIIFLCILADLILIPLELCLQDIERFNTTSFRILNIIQLIYLADIYICFHKSYYDKHVKEEMNLETIAIRYFESSDFCIDLFACSPIFAFFKIFYYPKGYNQLFLLVRIVKALKIKQIVIELHQKFYIDQRIYFIGYLISVLTILHLETCIWYSITMNRYLKFKTQAPLPEGATEEPPGYIDKNLIWLPPTYRNLEHEDLLVPFYEGSVIHRYSFIFYSCVLISSGNEIGPVTVTESWIASAYIILGLILTGVILGNISDFIENMNEEETNFERNIDEMQVKMKQNKIPDDIQEKILLYMNFCNQEGVNFNDPVVDFGYLATTLRKDFLFKEYEQLKENVPLFSSLSKDEVFEICSRFRTWIYLPGDTIIKQGDPCKELYYIRKGRVRVVDQVGKEDFYLEEERSFNELSFVFDSVVLHTVIAEDFCVMDVLTKESYEEILERRADLKKDIKQGLKSGKIKETTEIIEAMQKAPFFSEFTLEELKVLYKEYMDVLYLNPNTLVTAPTSKCNALYFIIQGTISRYEKSSQNYEFMKLKVLGEEEEGNKDEFESFVQKIDFMEKRKALQETTPFKVLTKGDWLGNLPLYRITKNFYFDLTESFCELVYISVKALEDIEHSNSSISRSILRKLEAAYRLHVSPVLKDAHQEYLADSQDSINEANEAVKELKLQKGLKEVEEVLGVLLKKHQSEDIAAAIEVLSSPQFLVNKNRQFQL